MKKNIKNETSVEVHHHSHAHGNPPAGPAGKNWKSYFWEFLMLFLAVFCGFLAENQREHMVEQHRAKQYAKRLLDDLKGDTAEIRRAALFEDKTVLYIDSLVHYIKDSSKSKTGTLYYYSRFATWAYNVDWNRSTINQLISSGNLRYFANDELVNNINAYYTITASIILAEEIIEQYRQQAIEIRNRMLKAEFVQKLMDITMSGLLSGKYTYTIDSLRKAELPLANKDPGLLNDMTNALLASTSNRKQQKTIKYPEAIKQAEQIMELLKKEYHLE